MCQQVEYNTTISNKILKKWNKKIALCCKLCSQNRISLDGRFLKSEKSLKMFLKGTRYCNCCNLGFYDFWRKSTINQLAKHC